MAQQKKRNTTSRTKSAGSGKSTSAQKTPKYSKSGIAALVFIFLGIFTLLGYFNNDGVFIKFLRGFMSGLLGGGFYLLPPMLIVAGGLLAVNREKAPVGRVICALLVPILAGAFCQLFAKGSYSLSFDMFKGLWTDGTALEGGGALGGAVTILFTYLFSDVGTAIILVCISAVVALSIFGLTIPAIIDMFRESRSEEEPYPEEPPKKTREKKGPERPEDIKPADKTKTSIDIPIDDPVYADVIKRREKKPSLFNRKPNAPAPDELLGGTGVRVEEGTENQADKPEINQEALKPEVKAEEKPVMAPEPIHAPESTTAPEPIPEPAREVKRDREPLKAEPEAAGDPELQIRSLIEESARRDLEEAMQSYKFPPLSLLNAPVSSGKKDSQSELIATKDRLEMTLKSFGINATISNVVHGPSITRYEMELEIGVKLNKLTNLSDDIALSLGVAGVRIAAIPNKVSTVGIEVPNKNVSTVYLREIIASPEFRNASSKLTFAIGKNISGDVMVGNISKLPHLLVAGTTGSGKSVCLNSLILSLMYKASPEEVRFIMIDPKMVEFKIYNGIPHLLIPVVTEAKKAAGALQWAVTEMMKRYRLFSDTGARDLAGYNEVIADSEDQQPLPQIVVIIDELADLMMIAAKEVEESICRVAQMGRAAGVHLVIATQSPRADVITGLMKANIPSRIAFKVASSLESRIILDAGGAADKLVGNGDMLFAPIGTSKPIRIQGAWVSDEERERVVEFVKAEGQASYSEEVIDQIEKAAADKNDAKGGMTQEEKIKSYDDLLPQAAEVIFETKQASVSMLQRRLKLGYARAARLIDQLEEVGVVGPFEGSKPRQILITHQQWQEMQFINGTAPVGAPQQPAAPPPAPAEHGRAQQNMYSADDLFDENGSNQEN